MVSWCGGVKNKNFGVERRTYLFFDLFDSATTIPIVIRTAPKIKCGVIDSPSQRIASGTPKSGCKYLKIAASETSMVFWPAK